MNAEFFLRSVTQMKSELLRRLYFGEIHPWERTATPDADEQELNQRIDKSIQALCAFMSTKEVASLEQLLGDIDSLKAEETVQAFIDGYRLGAQLMLETLDFKPLSSRTDDDGVL